MIDEQNVAETSAATAVADVQFDGWDEQGTPIVTTKIEPKKQEAAPAETPAKEANSEPEGKTEAESETAPKQRNKERKPGEKLSAEERISQLTAKVREMEERERSREAAPKPPAKEPESAKAEAPKRPNPFNWKGTQEEYDAAMEVYEKHQREQILAEFQQNEAQKAKAARMKGELEELKAKYPDAEDKLQETLQDLYFSEFATHAQLHPVIRAMLDDSECFPDLMYVLSDKTTRSNFIETATQNPGKAIRALAQMEADILRSRTASAKTESSDKSDPKPPAEPKPRAPKPPSEVGGRGGAPDDELRVAAAAGDFRSFEAEQNRRKFAKN